MRLGDIPDVDKQRESVGRERFGCSTDELVDYLGRCIECGV